MGFRHEQSHEVRGSYLMKQEPVMKRHAAQPQGLIKKVDQGLNHEQPIEKW